MRTPDQNNARNPEGYGADAYAFGQGSGAPQAGAASQSAVPQGAAPQGAAPQGGGQVRGYGMGGAAGRQQPPAQPSYGQPQGYAYPQGYYAGQPGAGMRYVPPATSQPQQVKPKRRKRFWIAIIVAVICLALAAVLIFTMTNGGSNRQGDYGQLDGKTDAEIQAELDRVVDEGMFNISIASLVQFPSGTSEGELRIENVPGNQYLMSVVITRDDTGEQIYQTDYIEPNHHVQADTLDVDLPAGNYECTATFFAYDPETEDMIGQAAAKMDIEVLS